MLLSDRSIIVEPVPNCLICNDPGRSLYIEVRDWIFGAPGSWDFSICSKCGLVWLNPRPSPVDIAKVYRSYYTHAVSDPGAVFLSHFQAIKSSAAIRDRVARHIQRVENVILNMELGYRLADEGSLHTACAHLAALIPYVRDAAVLRASNLPARERGRLLDVGCGNGQFLSFMRDIGWQVTGVEVDSQAAAFARRHFQLEVFNSSLEEARFPEGTFRAVNVSHVIEHAYDPLSLLRDCKRVLQPGGILIVTTPNINSLGHRIFQQNWRGLESPRHLHLFSPAVLADCVSRLGLKVESLATSNRGLRGIWYSSRLIQRANTTGTPRNSLGDYIASCVMPILADVVNMFVHSLFGEEIVLMARKPQN